MLNCGLNQPVFTLKSSKITGPKADQKSLDIQAKQDAWNKIRAKLQPMLGDDCPANCDYLVNITPPVGGGWKNAQAPWVCVFAIDWSRTTAGQLMTVQATFSYMITYICGNA